MNNSVIENIPALVIALPLLVAPLIAMLASSKKHIRRLIWWVVFVTIGSVCAGCIYLFYVVYNIGPLSYFMGAWAPPIGIEYEATKFNTLLLVLISGVALVLMPFGANVIEKEIPHKRTALFYACFLLLLAGLMGMVITNDLFNIYVFLEISSLATYALVAMGQKRVALTASFNYLIVGTIGGAFFLTGVAFLYALTGSLNISDIAYQIGLRSPNKPMVAAIVFIFVGLAIKSAIVPFAGWLPRVYATAPSFVVAFMAGVATKVPLYLIAKVFYVIFGLETALAQFQFGNIILLLSVLAIFYGGIAALFQTNLTRLLAFSSIANIGFILLGIGLGSKTALTAAVILFISHAVAKSGLFVVASLCQGSFNGLAKKSPYIAAVVILFGFSLVGIPLTAGFLPKWYILLAAMELGGFKQFVALLAIIAGSLLSAGYVYKIISQLYSKEDSAISFDKKSVITLSIYAAVTVLLGFAGSPIGYYLGGLAGEFAK